MNGFTLPARSRLISTPDLLDPVAEDARLTPRDLLAAVPMGSEEMVDVTNDDLAYDEVSMEQLFSVTVPARSMVAAGDARMPLLLPDLVDPLEI